jgi:hypothetical protein
MKTLDLGKSVAGLRGGVRPFWRGRLLSTAASVNQ